MNKKALLLLEDGSSYEGISFGAENTVYGEVVFDTAMAGYQEMLTDPSFAGQIVMPTYPLIGNYGINQIDNESKQIQVRGFIVREYCPKPSHWQNICSLQDYLKSNGIPGLSGIDTRALVRRLRSSGVMMGILTSEMTVEEARKALNDAPSYGTLDFIQQVSTQKPYQLKPNPDISSTYHIVVVDMGVKHNITRILERLGCRITVVPAITSEKEILNFDPDGILLSPGPGDPALLDYLTKTIKSLIGKKPIMGICLGHQLIAHAFGAKTFKLKFGHRGGNHPVRDLSTGRIYITTQ